MKDLRTDSKPLISRLLALLSIVFTVCIFASPNGRASEAPLTGITGSREGWHNQTVSYNSARHLDLDLSYSALNEAWRIVEEIVVKYPPSEYVYVGLGRSPTLFFAIMELLKVDNPYIVTTFLPLSLRGAGDHIDGRFRSYIKEYILNQTRLDYLGPRKLLVFDFVSSGETLKIVQKLIPDAKTLGFGSTEVVTQMRAQGFTMIELKDERHSLLEFLNLQISDQYSPYPSLRIADFFTRYNGRMPRPVVVRSQEYMTLINYLAHRKNINNVRHCRQIFK